jgi:hypothetical protein
MGRSISQIEIGSRFGKWTVIAQAESDKGVRWLCRCECGSESKLRGNYLRYRSNGCRSCASKRRTIAKGAESKLWSGCGKISGHYWSTIVRSARKRGFEMGITVEDAWDLVLKQKHRCAFTGLGLLFGINQTASLDRIDSAKGYVSGNVQWVHKTINLMKNYLSDDEFIDWCRAVCNHRLSVSYR